MRKTLWTTASTVVEYLDAWADWLPSYSPDEDGRWRWWRHAGWGCRWQVWGRFANWLEETGRVDRA
jgi:hypothetical protein